MASVPLCLCGLVRASRFTTKRHRRYRELAIEVHPYKIARSPSFFISWSLSSRDPHPLLPKRGFLISAMRPGIIWPANRQAFREYFFKTIKYKIYSVKEIAHLSAFSIYRLLLHALNTFSAFISSNLRLRFIFLSRASLIAAILHLLEYLLSHRKAPNWRAECIMIMVLLPLSFSSSLM